MPKAYYQCPKCHGVFSTKYQGGESEAPRDECRGGGQNQAHEPTYMTFRGNGWDGRDNLPYGRPPSWEKKETDDANRTGDTDPDDSVQQS